MFSSASVILIRSCRCRFDVHHISSVAVWFFSISLLHQGHRNVARKDTLVKPFRETPNEHSQHSLVAYIKSRICKYKFFLVHYIVRIIRTIEQENKLYFTTLL